MGHRRIWQDVGQGIVDAGLVLAPLTTAWAKNHSHHNTSTSAVCADVKAEQKSSSSVGLSIERAIASGNVATAKQAMLNVYNGDLDNVQKALAVIKQAPPQGPERFKSCSRSSNRSSRTFRTPTVSSNSSRRSRPWARTRSWRSTAPTARPSPTGSPPSAAAPS